MWLYSKFKHLLMWLPVGRVAEIDALVLADRIRTDQPTQILDVRTIKEWQAGHIKNAVNVPITQLAKEVHQLPFDKNIPTVVICLSAHRSIPAVRLLKRIGYSDVKQLKGGMRRWLAVIDKQRDKPPLHS